MVGCHADQVTAVLLGCDLGYPGNSTVVNPARLPSDRPYILHVGGDFVNKNVGTLLEAYHKLRTHNLIQHALIMVGAYHRSNAKLRSRFLSIIDDVVVLKDVSREFLLSLYREASLFVFPSVYEGFGLPILEAMANKVPVITSNRSSLPEVVGDAAVLVDPLDVDGLASAILTLLTDNDLREQFIMKGLQRAREFSWEKTAKATLQVYYAAANQGA